VTSAKLAPIVGGREDDVDATAGRPAAGVDLQGFLPAVAGLLHDTVARLEETVGRVTDMVTAQRGRAGPDLVVALQDFDRLQQEFVALGNALKRYAAASDNAVSVRDGHAEFGHIVAAIEIGDLRERFLSRLQGNAIEFFVPLQADEEIF